MSTALNPLDLFFQKIFCINLDRSPERWAHVQKEADRFGIRNIERFRGYDFKDWERFPKNLREESMHTAMCGCSHSHAGIFHLIAHHGWDSVLVLEDDFEILHDDFLERFAAAIPFIPKDWDILYLGAHYGEVPTERINQFVVRAGYIKTTSSYAIRGRHARTMAPIIGQCSGPDDILSGYNPHVNAYVLHPRLIGQYKCQSTIWGGETHNTQSMTDPHHDAAIEQL